MKSGENKVIKVVMVDQPLSEVPKTGDASNLAVYTLTGGFSVVALAVLLMLENKRRNNA